MGVWGSVYSVPAIAYDATILVAGAANDNSLHALNTMGGERWKYQVRGTFIEPLSSWP